MLIVITKSREQWLSWCKLTILKFLVWCHSFDGWHPSSCQEVYPVKRLQVGSGSACVSQYSVENVGANNTMTLSYVEVLVNRNV